MRRILFVCFFTLLTLVVFGQGSNKKEIGLRVLYGIENERLPENKIYKPILILPYYNYYLTKSDKKFRFSTFVEGQIVPVIEKQINNGKEKSYDWEFGFNIGPSLSYKASWITPYLGVAYGADFITVETRKQADGLIFAATAFAGLKKEIKNQFYGDIHCRFRHISNGGLKYPNYGIDTIFLGVGISKLF